MWSLIINRLLWMGPTLLIISILSFVIIQLPPGDYLTSYVSALQASGEPISMEQAQALRQRYNLDEPAVTQYLKWMGFYWFFDWKTPGLLQGNMGMSFEHNRPVWQVISQPLLLTVIVSIVTLQFTWGIAIPVGIYSAVRKYSLGDYIFTFIGFIGLATPNFLLALVFMYLGYKVLGVSPGGLFSPQYQNAPWSMAKFINLLAHLWIPVIVIGTSGTAGMIRVMRGNLLDELSKQYVTTARAKGVHPTVLLLKYPVRVALNPFVSTIGWLLPGIVSGSVIVAVVLTLPMVGPNLLNALLNQDMYLAGSLIMMLSVLTVIGTLISDLLLLWLDPRIRYGGRSQ